MAEFWIGMVQTADDIGEPDWFASAHATEAEARESFNEYDEDEILDTKAVLMTTAVFSDAKAVLASHPDTVGNVVCSVIPWLAAVADGGTWDLDAHERRMLEKGYDPIPAEEA